MLDSENETTHEKIRFRRDEIVRLNSLPSAAEAPRPVRGSRRRRAARWLAWGIGGFLLLAVLAPTVFYVAVTNGAGSERLKREAETVLTALLGTRIETSFGAPGMSFDGVNLLTFDITDVRLAGVESGLAMVDADRVRFGLRLMPLLSGRIQLGTASIGDARISLAALPPRPGSVQWTNGLIGEDGLIEPRLVGEAIFSGLHRAFEALERGSTGRLAFRNVEVILPERFILDGVKIETAEITRTSKGTITFVAALSIDGRPVRLEGHGEKDAESGLISAFQVALNIPHTEYAGPFSDSTDPDREFAFAKVGGALDVTLSGAELVPGAGSVAGNIVLKEAAVDFVNGERIAGGGTIRARLDAANRKIEIERAALTAQRSVYEFHGAVGPSPAAEGKPPRYRYELVSDGSTVAPSGSTEPDLRVLARVAGHYTPVTRVLTAESGGCGRASERRSGERSFRSFPARRPASTWRFRFRRCLRGMPSSSGPGLPRQERRNGRTTMFSEAWCATAAFPSRSFQAV